MHLKSNLGNLSISITYRFTNHISSELIQEFGEDDSDSDGYSDDDDDEDDDHLYHILQNRNFVNFGDL